MTSGGNQRPLSNPKTTNVEATFDGQTCEASSSCRCAENVDGTETQRNSDYHVDLQSIFTGDIEHICGMVKPKQSTNTLKPHTTFMFAPPSRSLPNELATTIIDHINDQATLFECTLVNKQFYTITNPLLWYSPKLIKDVQSERFMTSIQTTTRQRMVKSIRKLTLQGRYWTDNCLRSLFPQLHQLESLSIGKHSHISFAALEYLSLYCLHHLTHMQLTRLSLPPSVFDVLGHYCPQLCYLNLHYCDLLRHDFLDFLTNCPLTHLQIWFDPIAEDNDIDDDDGDNNNNLDNTIEAGLMKLDRLTHLSLVGCSHLAILHLVTTASTTTTCWPYLKHLELGNCGKMDDTTWIAFIKSHPHLQTISLRMAFELTNTSLDAMGYWLEHLNHVFFSSNFNMSFDGLCYLIRHCPELVCVEMAFCNKSLPSQFVRFMIPAAPVDGPSPHSLTLDQHAIDNIRRS